MMNHCLFQHGIKEGYIIIELKESRLQDNASLCSCSHGVGGFAVEFIHNSINMALEALPDIYPRFTNSFQEVFINYPGYRRFPML